MNIRNEKEALTVALEMEKRAIRTYERAKMMLPTDEMIAAVDSILKDERAHAVRFQQMLDGAVPAEEVDADLTAAVAGDALFKGGVMGMQRENAFTDVRSLYEFAARSEKEAVTFYTACAAECADPAIAAAFRSIAGEESSHLCALNDTLSKM